MPQQLTPSREAYQWIGEDGGFKVGHKLDDFGLGHWLMISMGKVYYVDASLISRYGEKPIEEPKK